MTVEAFVKESGFKAISLPCPEKEIDGAYVGDLLSWVMGRAESGNLWITIMSNVNVVAVASLADISAVILAENVALDNEVCEVARAKGINILSSEKSAYHTAAAVRDILR